MLKDIVFHLEIGAALDATAKYAISVAQAYGAYLEGMAFAYHPVLPPAAFGGGLPVDVLEAQRAAVEDAARATIAKFEDAARSANVSGEGRMIAASTTGGADLFARMARRFDLSIVGQADPESPGPQQLMIEASLFQSGRPVIVVPYIQEAKFTLDRVLVCWDASRSAARAVGDATPLLTRAKAIDVVVVRTESGGSKELPGAGMAKHLSRHAANVKLKRLVAGDIDVANAILSYAADVSADFIVMGGYGHWRFREVMLGGATRDILSSMTVPALMSH